MFIRKGCRGKDGRVQTARTESLLHPSEGVKWLLTKAIGFLVAVLLATAAPANAANRLAVLIANNEYSSIGALQNPEADIALVGEALRKVGFEVVLRSNLNQADFRGTALELSRRSKDYDITLVYYAGHGAQIAGTNYLLPVDLPVPNQEDDIKLLGISADDLIAAIKSPFMVIVLDACRDNPMLSRNLSRGRSAVFVRGLAPISPSVGSSGGIFVAYSTQANDVAQDGEGEFSPFAEAFAVNVIRPLSIDDMFALVTKDVLEKTNGLQRPFKYASMDTIVCLTGSCAHGEFQGAEQHTVSVGQSQKTKPTPITPGLTSVNFPSIAVLPFANLGPVEKDSILAEGVSGEILEALSHVSGLHVSARGSSFQFADRTQDLRITAAQLGVENLLTGTIRRIGEDIRIMAQLVRVADGVILWSGVLDSSLEEIMQVRQAVAEQVAAALDVPRTGVTVRAEVVPWTGKQSAFETYLEARYLLNTRKVENVHKAVELLGEVTSKNPTFAEAQSAYAVAALISRDYPANTGGYVPITQAERAARSALEIDPGLAEAYAVLGMIAAGRRDWSEAESRFQEAMAAGGQSAMVNMWYANFLRAVGRLTEATTYFRLAWRLDPLAAVSVGNLAIAYVSVGEMGAAREVLRSADDRGIRHPAISIAKLGMATIERDPVLAETALAEWFAYFPGWMPIGSESVFARAILDPGSRDAAKNLLEDLIQDERQLQGWGTLLIAAMIGDFDTAFASADHSSPQGGLSWGIAYWYPAAADWRRDARFKGVLQRLQLPDYWRRAGWPDSCRATSDDDFECVG